MIKVVPAGQVAGIEGILSLSCNQPKGYIMNRTEYMAARQLIRNNGQRAIPWLQPEHAVIMLALGNQLNDDIAAKEWFYNLTTKFSGTPNQWRI